MESMVNGRTKATQNAPFHIVPGSPGERDELVKLGLLSEPGDVRPHAPDRLTRLPSVPRRATSVPEVLNEAYHYARPSSFSRALSFDIADTKILLVSGTASVDEEGRTIHVGDFRAQCWRMYRNITSILTAEDMTWHDVVRTSCYLRDIERDYRDFNEVRSAFYSWHGLDPLPASTGIQARLCREDLLVETEAIAVSRLPEHS
jgi:enamine deaminase RidA (YjgF/YER057c/UK114 family)